jgi:hypothetical protein
MTMATPAKPCSVVAPLPTPQQLVQRADVIVRARAVGYGDQSEINGSSER